MGESGKAFATDRLMALSSGRRRNSTLFADRPRRSDWNLAVSPDRTLRFGRGIEPHVMVPAVMVQDTPVSPQMMFEIKALHAKLFAGGVNSHVATLKIAAKSLWLRMLTAFSVPTSFS